MTTAAFALALAHAAPAAQPAPTPQTDYEAWERALEARLNREIDALVEAGRTADERRIAALMIAPDAPMGGPRMTDYRASAAEPVALTREAFQAFATQCRRSVEQEPFVMGAPYTASVNYECGGEAGYVIFAIWDGEGERIESISVWGPRSSRELSPEEIAAGVAEAQAEAAQQETERVAEESRYRATVDALFAAAAAGDRVRFAALLGSGHEGRGAAFSDQRNDISGADLTIEAVRPLASSCRRTGEPSQVMSGMEPTDISLTDWFLCDGQRTYVEAGFEDDGAKIGWLTIEGEVRRPDPRLR